VQKRSPGFVVNLAEREHQRAQRSRPFGLQWAAERRERKLAALDGADHSEASERAQQA